MSNQTKPRQSPTQRWASLLVSHGARFDKRLASETKLAQARLRKQQIATLCSTGAFVAMAAILLSPFGARQLYQRTPLSLGMFAAMMIVILVWMIQMRMLAEAWIYHRDVKKLGQPPR